MRFEYLLTLREKNASWRLLASPQACAAIAFFYQTFIRQNRRAIAEQELTELLEDFFYDVNLVASERFTRPAKEYLEIWSDLRHAWLRQFYVKDVPHYDMTAAAQKAVEWVYGMRPRSFIGTESRLRTVFDLLRQIVRDAGDDPEARLALLEEEKARIETQIAALREGRAVALDAVQVKERFLHAAATARSILADFREVEENFRRLEREMLEKIVTWTHGKGELLAEIFAEQDQIAQSEQGRSFAAFWKFLMGAAQQEEFTRLLAQAARLEGAREAAADYGLEKINVDWFIAAAQVQSTIAALSKQIRRYVDENYLEEERRIYALIQAIEVKAVAARENPPRETLTYMEAMGAELSLPLDRPLFTPSKRSQLSNQLLEDGRGEASVEALFAQVHVDRAALKRNIDAMLMERPSVSLTEVVAAHPLRHGLTELLAYFVLAGRQRQNCFSDAEWEEILLGEADGKKIAARCEKIVFSR